MHENNNKDNINGAINKRKKNESWRLMYSNIRGMKGKKNSLTEILHDHDPHLYLLTETQLRSNIGMRIEGYNFYGRKREGKNGGGVGILVRNDILNKTAPHISDRNIELMWISLQTKTKRPIIIGVYYGQQESRLNKNEIELEMSLLKEEIIEMSNEGDVLLAMDGNARIGLLGEQISRNGKLLLHVFKETGLEIMNESEICEGKVTRKNTKNANEMSAIDFVVACPAMSSIVTRMLIDEDGLYKIKGKHETDHNTICLEMKINNIDKMKVVRKTDWNLRASSEKWALFGEELGLRTNAAEQILSKTDEPFENRYSKWYGELENAAMKSIGKTTFKEGGKEKFSDEVKELRKSKKTLKTSIRNEGSYEKRQETLQQYKHIQEEITQKIDKERKEIMKQKLEKIVSDRSKNSFWKEKKKMSRDPVLQALTIKDDNGLRQFQPESIKHHTAQYYQNLYREKPYPARPYHHEVVKADRLYQNDREHEDLIYNALPTEVEVIEAINDKSNGKSTTDIKNEMLKRPGEKMSKFVYTLIKQIWEEEEIPKVWNTGQITSIWKGRGDKERLQNHRGITTSSAIGSIVEILIDNRIEAHIPFTQAQGGGQRGASTCDHLFLLRTSIDIAKTEKRPIYITFYDVTKAYDNADNTDMLKILWDHGLRGKVWRILKKMNTELKAKVKTKHGLTEEIDMEVGGRQGSRATGRMFSKMMDLLSEEALDTDMGFKIFDDLTIPFLLWVDDVVSFAEGTSEQWSVLGCLDQFAKDHKLRWGMEKCQVMKVGKHKKDDVNEWKIGEMAINETKSYKYLGDVITDDGKNSKNLETRREKTIATTISIKTVASNEVFREIGTKVLMELHDTTTLSALLTNSESWTLNKKENGDLEQMETQSIKLLFDLPSHTPTPALIYTFGLLYTSLRVQKRQLLYLWKVVNRDHEHWTLKALTQVMSKNIGWGKSINGVLAKHNLPTDLPSIKRLTRNEWNRKVSLAIERSNKERLIEELYKTENGVRKRKTKTASIVDFIEHSNYERKPLCEIMLCSKQETKAIVTARYGMLECGKNFKGTQTERCQECNVLDDENHRLNYCTIYKDLNNYDSVTKIDYQMIHSDDPVELRRIVYEIMKVWNLRNANGTMNTE